MALDKFRELYNLICDVTVLLVNLNRFFLKKMGHSRPKRSFQQLTANMFILKFCQWLDSNGGPLVLAVTALPTEPQLHPLHYSIHIHLSHLQPIHVQQLQGFVCAYHPVVPGSNPKHTMDAFIVQILYYNCHFVEKRTKINKKRLGLGHILKNTFPFHET